LPDVRERLWAADNGFVAVEFTAALDNAVRLLERGVPFQLTLVDAGFSHSQVVVGADRIRGSIWLTDSGERRTSEAPFSVIAERYASTGPRALVIVPAAEAHRLDGLELPDRERYDRLHSLQSSLHRHDRAAAVTRYEEMKGADPGHRVTRLGRMAVARYDANPTQVLLAVDALIALFPADNTFHLARLNVLRDLGRRDERTEHARQQCLRKDADPLFTHHYAQALLPDPDRHPEVERMMRRAVRQRPYAPAGYYILANVVWEERRFQEATDLYRFAAALEDRDEQFSEAYFRAARPGPSSTH
jgi:tetratricopeptide (TPR) repeat protein